MRKARNRVYCNVNLYIYEEGYRKPLHLLFGSLKAAEAYAKEYMESHDKAIRYTIYD